MPSARQIDCLVIRKLWLTPTVLSVRFEPNKHFRFDAGQFISIVVPRPFAPPGSSSRMRRIYSLAAAPGEAYELCVKITGGPGPAFLAHIKEGERFQATAPYGDFVYEPHEGRSACFISTGTGIAPFKSIFRSDHFQESPPSHAISLFGARDESELLFRGEFERLGVQEVFALSSPEPGWSGFTGRVTDYLKSLPSGWPWHSTDFYLCGNGQMVQEVKTLLQNSKGVSPAAIHAESYFGVNPSRPAAEPTCVRRAA